MRRYRSVLVLLGLLAVPYALSQVLPLRSGVVAVIASMREGSALGIALYVGVSVLGAILTVPIWVFSGMAGYVYGPVRGMLLASPVNLVAMTSAFLLGRFALSGWLGRRLARIPRWNTVHGAVAADAFRIGLLLRLSPVAPQNLFSYGLSLTPMRARTFMAVTWLGLFPTLCFQVYVGSLVHDVADLVEGKRPPLGVWGWVATAAGVLVTVGAVVALARLGRRALARRGV